MGSRLVVDAKSSPHAKYVIRKKSGQKIIFMIRVIVPIRGDHVAYDLIVDFLPQERFALQQEK